MAGVQYRDRSSTTEQLVQFALRMDSKVESKPKPSHQVSYRLIPCAHTVFSPPTLSSLTSVCMLRGCARGDNRIDATDTKLTVTLQTPEGRDWRTDEKRCNEDHDEFESLHLDGRPPHVVEV
jgi:hypothetical protein